MERMIDEERSRLLSAKTNGPAQGRAQQVNELAAKWQALQLDLEFSVQAVKAATTAYETAQETSGQKVKSLLVVSQPSLAEESTYPRTLYDTVTLLVGCAMAYAAASMILATIREHRD
jgi:capsular polysaccharide transport system permease protein